MTDESIYEIISYQTLNKDKIAELQKADPGLESKIEAAKSGSGQKALANMTIFPLIMLLCYHDLEIKILKRNFLGFMASQKTVLGWFLLPISFKLNVTFRHFQSAI